MSASQPGKTADVCYKATLQAGLTQLYSTAMAMEDLCITFGKKHKDETFKSVLLDFDYVQWFLKLKQETLTGDQILFKHYLDLRKQEYDGEEPWETIGTVPDNDRVRWASIEARLSSLEAMCAKILEKMEKDHPER